MKLLLALFLVSCAHDVKRSNGGVGLLPVGADAPELVAHDVSHREVRLSGLRGHSVVVYFYPMDGSPGCTREACAFRDVWQRFREADVAIVGVSSNSDEDHQRFLENKHLPFALASDRDGALAAAYGVTKHFWGEARVTFLIDKNGKIARVWPSVDPGVHADEVLAAAKNQ